MKINEVEQLVGISKRNIRFYEKEGLLSPGRNADNGYRDYGEEDVETLHKIKLLRKLDVPLEEIRRMQQGELTLADGLLRHVIQLERAQKNLGTMRSLCQELARTDEQLPNLDAGRWLAEMERMEQEEGTQFVNIRKKDTRKRYVGPVVAAAVFVGLMAGIIGLILWAISLDPADAPPLWLLLILIAVPSAVIVGVLLALWQRLKQIQGGEEGSVVQCKNFGKDFMAGMKTLVGGEIEGYTEMLNEARQIATKRMVDEAIAMEADAVIAIRYASASIMQSAAEICAYGTAVRVTGDA